MMPSIRLQELRPTERLRVMNSILGEFINRHSLEECTRLVIYV